ncbi:hypothetical protein FOZ60_008924 [Perkinsus olseni]|uniref:Uncharacterized protein n=1 Tax=Perkinsus olseni TaxID=32597 RepID=A0A7J6NII4_PEROL|nr:hypothetical protein FOZ60_008924 [Perkinsus olseni]
MTMGAMETSLFVWTASLPETITDHQKLSGDIANDEVVRITDRRDDFRIVVVLLVAFIGYSDEIEDIDRVNLTLTLTQGQMAGLPSPPAVDRGQVPPHNDAGADDHDDVVAEDRFCDEVSRTGGETDDAFLNLARPYGYGSALQDASTEVTGIGLLS